MASPGLPHPPSYNHHINPHFIYIVVITIIIMTNLRENKRQRDANNTTLMLIVVISVFLAVELPLMFMSALHTINSRYMMTITMLIMMMTMRIVMMLVLI